MRTRTPLAVLGRIWQEQDMARLSSVLLLVFFVSIVFSIFLFPCSFSLFVIFSSSLSLFQSVPTPWFPTYLLRPAIQTPPFAHPFRTERLCAA